MSSLLVTGFGPFFKSENNPSEALARRLHANHAVLPVEYEAVDRFVESLGDRSETDLLCLGVAVTRSAPQFELYAHNRRGNVADNTGVKRRAKRIAPRGAAVLGQTFLGPAKIPSCPLPLSYTPGDYLCNYLLYRLLHRFPRRRIGFVHVVPPEKVSLDDQLVLLTELIALQRA